MRTDEQDAEKALNVVLGSNKSSFLDVPCTEHELSWQLGVGR